MVKVVLSEIWSEINFSSENEANLQEIISEYIRELILTKKLNSGEKLPSLRELAKYIGVSLQTVFKATNSLIEEGYLYSIPKKGIFVSHSFIKTNINIPLEQNSSSITNLSTNSPAILFSPLDKNLNLDSYSLIKENIQERQRTLLENYFANFVFNQTAKTKPFFTYGAYQAIFVSLFFLKKKHKNLVLLCEKITFTPVLKICYLLKIQVMYVSNSCFSVEKFLDDLGLIKNKAKNKKYVLYIMNPLHNPLLYTYTKQEITKISNFIIENNMFVIEDGSFFFSLEGFTSFYSVAPKNTFTILTSSKFLPSMLRLGILYAPVNSDIKLLKTIHNSISWSMPLIQLEILTHLIESKALISYIDKYLEEIYIRNIEVKKILSEYIYKSEFNGCHVLIKSDPELDIVKESKGSILVSKGSSFSCSDIKEVFFDRVSLISVSDRNQLYDAILKIKTILKKQN